MVKIAEGSALKHIMPNNASSFEDVRYGIADRSKYTNRL